MTQGLIRLFEKEYGEKPEWKLIAGGGSPRKYFRLICGEICVIGVASEDSRENENFVTLDHYLESSGVNVPKVIAVSDDRKYYLLQDLGDTSLFKLLDSPEKMLLSEKALEQLIVLQFLPEEKWKNKVGYVPFSERLVKWDLNYFKYDFLKPYGVFFDENRLENDFDLLTRKLLDREIINGLMYRDFQSRNIMWHENKLWFIDFQGARKGPVAYDAVSFIWQAKAPFSIKEREGLCDFYIDELSKRGYSPDKVMPQIYLMQIFRTLQVMGAYGFRGLIERKAHFIESIPLAIKNLSYLREKGLLDEYQEIKKISERLQKKEEQNDEIPSGKLTLKVFSFSYKKGYPEDKTGNGGGFMFDCRAIHNPGRYEEYKNLTGRDESVKAFLEKTEEVSNFVSNALALVKPSVERYQKRGFTSLQVGFGCTGGQHRSVYCADRFAEEIKKSYPDVGIELIHREQGIKEKKL